MDISSLPKADLILCGAAEVLTCVATGADPIGRRAGASVAVAGERILAVGSPDEIARQVDATGAQIIDVTGKIVAPGFIDPHTHLVFGGSRVQEYAARMTRSAAEVRALGIPSGIQATVEMTRRATLDELTESAAARLARMFRHGTTTVESKSGYALSTVGELAMLRVNRRLREIQPVDVVSTFLGAHDFPADQPRDSYLDSILHEMIPQAAETGLAEFCDVYCDDGYYTVEETRRILEAGLAAGLKPKIHVDAYADIGGSMMAAGLPVVSADHLNYHQPGGDASLCQGRRRRRGDAGPRLRRTPPAAVRCAGDDRRGDDPGVGDRPVPRLLVGVDAVGDAARLPPIRLLAGGSLAGGHGQRGAGARPGGPRRAGPRHAGRHPGLGPAVVRGRDLPSGQ